MAGFEIEQATEQHTGLIGCACGSCSGSSGENASLDGQAGGTANGKPIWTADQIAAYLNRTGGQFGTGPNDLATRGGDPKVITYGFHENQQSLIDNGYIYTRPNAQGVTTLYAFSEYFQFAAFNAAQRAATREAMEYWDDVLAVSFVETSAYEGDINFGNLTNSPGTQAYSRIPTAGFGTNFDGFYGTYSIAGYAADIWVSVSQATNFHFDWNGYGMNTLTHEIGHSLGLSHPGNYNFGPNFAATYMNGAEYAQDARNYSIMSYWNPRDLGSTATGVPTRDFNWNLMNIAFGETPMIHDILAAQKMYGADTTTRTGDTTYGFNSTADRAVYDFAQNKWPTLTIWDAGGNDTLDASGYGVRQVIDLTPGSLSSIGGITADQAPTFAGVNAARAAAGLPPVTQAQYDANMASFRSDPEWRGRLTDNVGIAYGTTIENAKGGSGADLINGNAVANQLFGNGGDDLLFGRDGDDVLSGGLGNDTLDGGNGADRLDGGAGNDELRGGSGVDVLIGGAGNDRFLGDIGSTVIDAKRAKFAMDIIVDFDAAGDDVFDFTKTDANTEVDGIQAFTFVGRSAGKGVGELSFKTFGNVNAAEKALGIDIDEGGQTGQVTVVFGNTDSDADPEFIFVLLGAKGVEANDFII